MGMSASFLDCQVEGETQAEEAVITTQEVEKQLTIRNKHAEERVHPCPQTELDCSAVKLGVKWGSVCTCQDYLRSVQSLSRVRLFVTP